MKIAYRLIYGPAFSERVNTSILISKHLGTSSLVALLFARDNLWEEAMTLSKLNITYYAHLQKTEVISLNIYEILLKFIQNNKIKEANSLLADLLDNLSEVSQSAFKKSFLAMVEHSLVYLDIDVSKILYAVLRQEKRLILSKSLEEKLQLSLELEKNSEQSVNKILKATETIFSSDEINLLLNNYLSYKKPIILLVESRCNDLFDKLLETINLLKKEDNKITIKEMTLKKIKSLTNLMNFCFIVQILKNEFLANEFYEMLEKIKEKSNDKSFNIAIILIKIQILHTQLNFPSSSEKIKTLINKLEEEISSSIYEINVIQKKTIIKNSDSLMDCAEAINEKLSLTISLLMKILEMDVITIYDEDQPHNRILAITTYLLKNHFLLKQNHTNDLISYTLKTIYFYNQENKEKNKYFLLFFETAMPLVKKSFIEEIMRTPNTSGIYLSIKQYLLICSNNKIIISKNHFEHVEFLINFFINHFQEKSLEKPVFLLEVATWVIEKMKLSKIRYIHISNNYLPKIFFQASKDIIRSSFFSQALDMIWEESIKNNDVNLLLSLIKELIKVQRHSTNKPNIMNNIKGLLAILNNKEQSEKIKDYEPIKELISYLFEQENWKENQYILLKLSKFLEERKISSYISYYKINERLAIDYQVKEEYEMACYFLEKAFLYARKEKKIKIANEMDQLTQKLKDKARDEQQYEQLIYFLNLTICYHKKCPSLKEMKLTQLMIDRIKIRESLAEIYLKRNKNDRAIAQYLQAENELLSIKSENEAMRNFIQDFKERYSIFSSKLHPAKTQPVLNQSGSTIITQLADNTAKSNSSRQKTKDVDCPDTQSIRELPFQKNLR